MDCLFSSGLSPEYLETRQSEIRKPLLVNFMAMLDLYLNKYFDDLAYDDKTTRVEKFSINRLLQMQELYAI